MVRNVGDPHPDNDAAREVVVIAVVPDPRDPKSDAVGTQVDDGADGADAATVLSRLSGVMIQGLVHCACWRQSVHPDLLPLPTGDVPAGDVSAEPVSPARTSGGDAE